MRKGRARKAGKRYPGGKLVQPKEPTLIQPSAWVAGQVQRYGQHYCWALGRAYASGLLGQAEAAKDRLQGGAKFARLHRVFYGGEAYTCPLDDSPRGPNVVSMEVHDDQDRNLEWLRKASVAMESNGTRPYVEQLISRSHVDTGPAWLDRLLDVIEWNSNLRSLNAQLRKIGKDEVDRKQFDPRDTMLLNAAIKGLDIVAPPPRQLGIVAQHY